MISNDTKDRILQVTQIVDVIGEFVTLKRQGVNYTGCCPFHHEKTASFTVSPAKNIYKCFGCGKGGDPVNFLQEHESLSYVEALRWLGKKYNIEITEINQTPEEKAKADRRESLRVALEWGAKHFASGVHHPDGEAYLQKRQVSKEIIEKFRLGFAQDEWNHMVDSARKSSLKDEILINTSLATKTEKNNVIDYFRGRVMFPFLDLSGNVIGFTGRIIDSEKKVSKYTNSKDTELFSKGRVLFGLYQAKKAITAEDECYLVEGNFDVTSFHQAGVENTVCGSGTALTQDQIRLIKKFTNRITVIYDGDAAGIKASFRSIDLMLQEDVSVYAIALPAGEDPDSFAKKTSPEDLKKYLEDNRKDFISFKYEILKADMLKDPLKEAEFVKSILDSIILIPDQITRDIYKKQCINVFNINEKVVTDALNKVPKKEDNKEYSWIGLDWAQEFIKQNSQVRITSSIETMHSQWAANYYNVISYKGLLSYEKLQELNTITQNILYIDEVQLYDEHDKPTKESLFCKFLYKFGFNLKVKNYIDAFEDTKTPSFLEYYFELAAKYIRSNNFDQDKRNMAIEEAAELLALSDNITINVRTKIFSKQLGLKEGDFRKIMKPFLEKKRSSSTLQREIMEEDEPLDFTPDKIPDYVDTNFFQRWGYFPWQNKKTGEPERYVFRTQEGALQAIGNFYIEPLIHIKDPDPNRNKRIIKVNNAEQKRSYFVEMPSSAMIDFAQFKKVLFNEGGNIFTRGKSNHHETILASIAKDFKECWELNVYGQQHEGFFAFTNAIFADNQVTYMDDLGLATYKDKTYYCPVFSKIYSSLRKDNDKFDQDRFLIYKDNSATSFEEWSQLMDAVYKYNNNGKWALLFAIMAAFKSIIFKIDRLFTSPFIIGPTDSGKTQIAISIRSLFIDPDAPLFNLNSGSDAAFFTMMEKYRNIPVIFEEYNDYQITDIKFQGLKAAIYDNEGKTKRKDATSKDLDVSKINAVPIPLGQESPEKDDGSLFNRSVILQVPKKDDWTEEESTMFRKLKDKERAGLTNILIEVLKQKDVVSNNFQRIQREVFKELKTDLTKNGLYYQTRILNTISLFASMCKLWEDHVKHMKLPFTYKDFFAIAKAKIISQSEAVNSTNRLSVFFDTIQLLLNDKNGIKAGREFKIERLEKITIMQNRNDTKEVYFDKSIKVLFLRLTVLHPMYAKLRGNESLKYNNLMNYLKDHPAFLGNVKSTRFAWEEIEEKFDQQEDKVKKISKDASANTSAVAFNYELLTDIIDLEKYGDPADLIKPAVSVTYSKDQDTPAPEQAQINFAEVAPGDDLPF